MENSVTAPPETTKVVEHAEPSSMPELSWFWRRVFVYALTTFLCVLVWYRTATVTDGTQRIILQGALWTIDLLVLVYVVGASAEKVVQIVAAFKSTRKETITSGPGEPLSQEGGPVEPLPASARQVNSVNSVNRKRATWP